MGWIAAILMVLSGIALAVFVTVAVAIHRGEDRRPQAGDRVGGPSRQSIAVSVLFQIARLGGATESEALHLLNEVGAPAAPIVRDIEMASWAAAWASGTDPSRRGWLLEAAVKVAVRFAPTLPLEQYNALLDLSFGLGFHTDALARLRARYRYDYIDHARHSRPRIADEAGRVTSYRRTAVPAVSLMHEFGLEHPLRRQAVISAYRRKAAVYHPDRFHNAPPDEQRTASDEFIRLTEAYEQLLPLCEED